VEETLPAESSVGIDGGGRHRPVRLRRSHRGKRHHRKPRGRRNRRSGLQAPRRGRRTKEPRRVPGDVLTKPQRRSDGPRRKAPTGSQTRVALPQIPSPICLVARYSGDLDAIDFVVDLSSRVCAVAIAVCALAWADGCGSQIEDGASSANPMRAPTSEASPIQDAGSPSREDAGFGGVAPPSEAGADGSGTPDVSMSSDAQESELSTLPDPDGWISEAPGSGPGADDTRASDDGTAECDSGCVHANATTLSCPNPALHMMAWRCRGPLSPAVFASFKDGGCGPGADNATSFCCPPSFLVQCH
jgi:hypothetical protein